LGRIPAPKERVLLPQYGLEVTVEETDGRRILAATVRVTPPGAGEKP
jgi:CBS domain containing-hemolysin-like protein